MGEVRRPAGEGYKRPIYVRKYAGRTHSPTLWPRLYQWHNFAMAQTLLARGRPMRVTGGAVLAAVRRRLAADEGGRAFDVVLDNVGGIESNVRNFEHVSADQSVAALHMRGSPYTALTPRTFARLILMAGAKCDLSVAERVYNAARVAARHDVAFAQKQATKKGGLEAQSEAADGLARQGQPVADVARRDAQADQLERDNAVERAAVLAGNALVRLYVRRGAYDRAEERLAAMERANVPVLIQCFNAQLQIARARGDLYAMHTASQRLAELGLRPNTATFRLLMYAYAKENDVERFERTLQAALADRDVASDATVYVPALYFYRARDDLSAAARLFRHALGHAVLNIAEPMHVMMQLFLTRRRSADVLRMALLMRRLRVPPRTRTCMLLQHAAAVAATRPVAERLLTQIAVLRVKRTCRKADCAQRGCDKLLLPAIARRAQMLPMEEAAAQADDARRESTAGHGGTLRGETAKAEKPPRSANETGEKGHSDAAELEVASLLYSLNRRGRTTF